MPFGRLRIKHAFGLSINPGGLFCFLSNPTNEVHQLNTTDKSHNLSATKNNVTYIRRCDYYYFATGISPNLSISLSYNFPGPLSPSHSHSLAIYLVRLGHWSDSFHQHNPAYHAHTLTHTHTCFAGIPQTAAKNLQGHSKGFLQAFANSRWIYESKKKKNVKQSIHIRIMPVSCLTYLE